MRACNIIFWNLIIPILTYGAELWILKQSDIDILDKFQRYSGKRIQRFPKSTPNETSFRGLGWMRLENYIYAKKLIFIRTILIRSDECIYKKVFKMRAIAFNDDISHCMENKYDSPIFDILRIAVIYGIYPIVMNCLFNDHYYSKAQWKEIVWSTAWQVEDSDWDFCSFFYKSLETIKLTTGKAKYLSWWYVSDLFPCLIRQCETLARIVCKASRLKCDDFKFKGLTFFEKTCPHCNLSETENAEHMIMTCPYNSNLRFMMFEDLSTNAASRDIWLNISASDTLSVLLGGSAPNVEFDNMMPIWCIAAEWIHQVYLRTLEDRTGVG